MMHKVLVWSDKGKSDMEEVQFPLKFIKNYYQFLQIQSNNKGLIPVTKSEFDVWLRSLAK